MKNIIGLGLESSCDETAAAIVENGSRVLSNRIASQIDIHSEYYGVVPEIASRAHLEMINPLIDSALKESGLTFDDIDYVAATNRPGLIGSLMIGLQAAKTISYIKKIPLIAVNHLEAHLYAPFLNSETISYPYIGLLVSGGNTALYLMKGIGEMILLGRTMDDAIGEAFDKVSKFMELGYPGGPLIDKLARKAVKKEKLFPKLLAAKNADYRFSYSGLKTAVINYVKNNPDYDINEVAYSFQESAIEILIRRTFAAARDYGLKNIVIAGGVAANSRLRELFLSECRDGEKIIIPPIDLCTDNAAMIAGVSYHYFCRGQFDTLEADVTAKIRV
ncbi:MAG: tRNA (adenosine(37)-N6)-threonylcarbamoyltransferase complex transferase subunit TsaD [Spirochaetes bacterium]|nr:tRNA (adenosine(37)-N6)-threonylcarbamoyltransferase complex transferase subunit TsaD [Spirochaetota bacterium]MBN2769403.1 tRNA (adenosine(37)-N6)-threonylcarbamoyltransferase complex transferase subunit TsaD [Spirochaetota bacterium]